MLGIAQLLRNACSSVVALTLPVIVLQDRTVSLLVGHGMMWHSHAVYCTVLMLAGL
jgi:G:T-mismatch repair DNA endonuclease (very short patch repair protein)